MARTVRSILFSLLLTMVASAGFATSYVLPADETLVDQATLIVYARAEAVDTAPGEAATYTRFRVVEGLKGSLGIDEVITVRVLGGTDSNGRRLHIWGAPQFELGDNAVLFLDPRGDGTYGIHQFMLGAFHERQLGTETLGVRNLAETTQLGKASGARAEGPRNMARFKGWITDRVSGIERDIDYLAGDLASQGQGIQNQIEPFRFIISNPAVRYFEFDTGGSVPWFLNSNGSPLTSSHVNAARAAWNNDGQTPINYTFNGSTGASDGLTDFDDINVVLGGDPNNEMSGSFSCPGGGTLALGGPWFDLGVTGSFNGETWLKTFGGDIVFNNGVECYFSGSQGDNRAKEVLTHEFGHTLGLGHSCGDADSGACNTNAKEDATMNAFVHDDGRGASIRNDDRAGIRALYSPTTGGGGTPNAPTGLVAFPLSPTQALLSFIDSSSNETGFRVEVSSPGQSYTTLVEGPDNVSDLTVGGLTPGITHTFRVRALGGNTSGPSNEASAVQPLIVGGCVESSTVLCLNNDRFHVTTTFITNETSGIGHAEELTPDTGYFWFFNQDNVEIVTKMINACGLPGFDNYWVFAGGLTNVQVTLTVVDTETNQVRFYHNPLNQTYLPTNDTNAFNTCP
ncbi:MAG: matrixin family metalloprotease [Thermoanaerobaculia bacterium]|nr:matrixin family metalloprotease [Thermoanaerobaculia bacterium]